MEPRDKVTEKYPQAVAMEHTGARLWHVFQSEAHWAPVLSERGVAFSTPEDAWASAAARL